MINKKNSFYYISLALVLLLTLLFWRLPYISSIDGFAIMSLWYAGTWGVFVSLFQTLSFLTMLGLIAVPVLAIFSQRGIITIKATDKTLKLVNYINICVLAGLSFFNFVWSIVLAATLGVGFGIGSLFTAILVVGTFILVTITQYTKKTGVKTAKTKIAKQNNDEIVVEVQEPESN